MKQRIVEVWAATEKIPASQRFASGYLCPLLSSLTSIFHTAIHIPVRTCQSVYKGDVNQRVPEMRWALTAQLLRFK